MGKRKAKAKKAVSTYKHDAADRPNIPTQETSRFLGDEDQHAPPFVLQRDPSLDPQLVWTGKRYDDLEVPVTPVYVQEKIHPQALVDDLKKRAGRNGETQLDLFADFNGLDDFGKKIDFYKHPLHWTNRLILGDSLHVMASLAEKEGLRGKVQTVYMDPPYGIKFGSNWQVSTRARDVKDRLQDVTLQPEQLRAFRDTWSFGVNSYLVTVHDPD